MTAWDDNDSEPAPVRDARDDDEGLSDCEHGYFAAGGTATCPACDADALDCLERRMRAQIVAEIATFLRNGTYENPRTGGDRAIPGWKNAAEVIEREFSPASTGNREDGRVADDERRAEIEAVADILAWEYGLSERPSRRILEAAAKCIAALDRVRDARDDDEAGGRWIEPHDALKYELGDPMDDERAARSPQDEDHGPREIAAWLRQEHEAEHRVDTLAGVARRIEEHYGY